MAWLMLSGLLLAGHATAQIPKTTADRMQRVENSLIPYVPVTGFNNWNLTDRMAFHRVQGLSIAVMHNYRIDWVKAYGVADTTTRRPVTTETLFSAGSISKLVAAMAAMTLVDRKKMALDTPINTYLTSWTLTENEFYRQKPVTLGLLLSHRGGTSQSAYFGYTPDKSPLPSVVDILSGAPGTETRRVVVNSEPGKEFRYSGGGYLVAQQAMADVSKQDFATFTNEALFRKLGMMHSTFAQPLPKQLDRNAAWAYSENGWFKGMPYVYPQAAPAGLYSTPTDLARLLIDLQNSYRGKGGILSQAAARTMLTPRAPVSSGYYKEEIGMGPFFLQRTDNQTKAGVYFEHTGVNAGFLAYAIGSLEGGNGVVIMMNNDGGASELGKEIRRAVAQVYQWPGFLPDPITPRPQPESVLAGYVGRFQRGPDEVITFRKEQNYLVETINEGNPIYCFPIARDTIAFSDYPLKAYFHRNASGQVDSVRTEWQQTAMRRLSDNELLPNELIRAGRIAEAVNGYRAMKKGLYDLTYMAYDFTNRRPANLDAAKGILELAQEQHPQASIVYARWGDLYQKQGSKSKAITAYETATKLDPNDTDSREKLTALLAH